MRVSSPAAIAVIAVALLAACKQERPAEPERASAAGESAVPKASGFDFFVLALSWSPSYCASEGERANRQQCGSDRDFGFVVHGLWPQFTRGYPTKCPTERLLGVTRELAGSMLDIMPSTGLIRHEWATHGTCSGVSQEDYFALTRIAFETIVIPPEFAAESSVRTIDPGMVEKAFREANPGIRSDSIAVTCDRRYLRDVRICMTRDLSDFISCPEVDADTCAKSAVMPPVQ